MPKGFAKEPWQEMPVSQLEVKKSLFAKHNLPCVNCKRFYHNTHYYVMCFEQNTEWGTIDHLMVSHRKGQKISDHWQFLQQVKNEIMGQDRLAIEIYPPTTDLVDQVNAYHLWVFPIGFKLPFGLNSGWAGIQ